MRKFLTAALAAATLGGSMIAAAAPVDAAPFHGGSGFHGSSGFHGGSGFRGGGRGFHGGGGYWRGGHWYGYGGAALAGLALGAAIAGSDPYYYGPGPYYAPGPYGPACGQRYWDGYRWVWAPPCY